jgi:hypothetical protein
MKVIFTEGHLFGAIRAGTISYRLKTRPARMAVESNGISRATAGRSSISIEKRRSDGSCASREQMRPANHEAFRDRRGCGSLRIGYLADGALRAARTRIR